MDIIVWASPPTRMPPVFAASASQSGMASTKKTRLLLVEDDFLVAGEMRHALTEAGYDVVGIAGSADDAIELATTHEPQLVIMDVRLRGERDGVDAAVEIFSARGIRSIFATAHGDKRTFERAKRASPAGWLQKPYSSPALIELIRKTLPL
jgi:DNA-binding NarL/FixJ family response regulator